MRRARPWQERLVEKIDRRGPDECWLWTGCLGAKGYGALTVRSGKTDGAHRLTWMMMFGPIPDGLHVCHSCDNPPCCNPDHLWLGTAQDNMDDMKAKDRSSHLRGPDHGKCRYDYDVLCEIARRHRDGETQMALSAEYGVSQSHISEFVHGKVRNFGV